MSERISLIALAAAVVLLVVLKLTRVVAWSWWRVLAPLWIGAGAVLVMIVFMSAALAAVSWLER